MVQVDRAGIARAARAMGGEGTNLLLLQVPADTEVQLLDQALQPEVESPANGSWMQGPQGWLLVVEGLDEEVDPWIDSLASRLSEAGITGTLTGAKTAREPAWARTIETNPELSGLVGFTPTPNFDLRNGWACGAQSLQIAVDVGMDWLTRHDANLMGSVTMGGQFWVEPPIAARMMTTQAQETGLAYSYSYQRERREARKAGISQCAALELSSRTADYRWHQTVEELRSVLTTLPLQHVSIAMVSHRDWRSLFRTNFPGNEYNDTHTYRRHPELWGEFTLDPCGIQILTDLHLAKAHDLSNWRTTRLDPTHHLVEARELQPWFGTPLLATEPHDSQMLERARRDFGEMVLRPSEA